jgi:vanillate O-demethylase ferredoxin subunit
MSQAENAFHLKQSAQLMVHIARKHMVAQDICSLELRPLAGQQLPAFAPGAHIDVHLPGGLVRQYSLCNDCAEPDRYVIAVLHDSASRGGSAAVHRLLQVGQQLCISTPRNHFALHAQARRHWLLAGGIGITPLLSMARCLAREGGDFTLHYSARTGERMAFAQDIASAPWASQAQLYVDQAQGQSSLPLQSLLAKPVPDTHLYVCGPKGFMDAVLETARAAGWPPQQLHWEFFVAEAVQQELARGFEVELASTGQVVQVQPAQTVVEALASIGVCIPTSCEQGICGTCLTRVVAGEPEHHDLYLTEAEQAVGDQFTPCCSRAKSARLVLDL